MRTVVLALLFVLFFSASSAPAHCSSGNGLSFEIEDFFNQDNTNVKYYYSQADQSATTLGTNTETKVLFLRRLARRVGRAVRRVARRVGRVARRVGRAVGRTVKRVARAVGRAAKAVAKGVVKVVKAIGKAFGSLWDAIRGAKKKADKVAAVMNSYIGPYQKGGCSAKHVCSFDCSDLVNCPVKPTQKSDFKGFMDMSSDVKKSSNQMQAYKWVCKNTLFSGNNQRESFISIIWRRIAFGLTDIDSKEFETRNPNYSTTNYDEQYLKYLASKKIDGNDLEILSILNDYKDGLHGFSKICRLNPQWMNQISSTLHEFEQESMKKSYEKPQGGEADSTVEAFRKMRNYLSSLRGRQAYDPTSRYKFDLFNSLLSRLRTEFVNQLKGNKIQQEYCRCEDYGRFFYYMNLVSSSTRKNYYGIDNISFEVPYMQNLKNTCASRCVTAMKANGYSQKKINDLINGLTITVALKPGDKNDNRNIVISSDKKNGNTYTVTGNAPGANIKKAVSTIRNVVHKVAHKVVHKTVGKVISRLRLPLRR